MINSNKKYKIQKINLELSFDRVDRTIDFFRNLRNDIKSIYNQEGGEKKSNKDDKYYKKYKKLLKTSEYSIKYYKNFAQGQIIKQMQLNQYYTNLINVLNVHREYLLNEYLKLGKNVKNNKEKINMLETLIEGIEKYMKTPVEFENVINKIVLKGGNMDFDSFSTAILHDIKLFDEEMDIIKSDKHFIETKITDLHNRMKEIIEDNDHLFKIKTEIDWLVKELEYKEDAQIMEAQDFQALYDKLKITINEAQKGSKISEKVAQYMHKLKEYASYLENFIMANTKTTDTIDTQKKPLLNEHINSAQESLIGGNMNGGDLYDVYDQIETQALEKVRKYFNESEYINFTLVSQLKVSHSDIFQEGTKDVPVPPNFYRQLVTIVQQLKLLDGILNNFKIMYRYIGNYKNYLNHDESSEDTDFIKLWKKIFAKKNTDYYSEQILKYKIYFYINQNMLFEDVLKNLVIDGMEEKNNFKVEIDFCKNSKDNEDIINKIDNTIVCMDILTFFIISFILAISKMYRGINDIVIDVWEKYILEKEKKLIRTGKLVSFKEFDKIYMYSNNIIIGGNIYDDTKNKTFNDNINIDKEILLSYMGSYIANLIQQNIVSSDVLAKKEVKTVSSKVNLEQMEKLSGLAKILNRLDDKIRLKLGQDTSRIDSFIKVEDRITSYAHLLTKINDKKPEEQNGGEITQPRLTPFKSALIKCSQDLQPYVQNVNQLKYLISGTRKKDLDMEETIALFSIFTKLKSIVNTGINSYMKVIPMIFYTIEYPPSRYSSDKCKFKFTYDETNDLVEYLPNGNCEDDNYVKIFKNDLQKSMDAEVETKNKEEKGEQAEKEKKEMSVKEKQLTFNQFYSHAAFLESNNQNGTKKIITDPIIGLEKLLDIDSDKSKPINRVMNIMFALGASGTGKTSRYFGVPTATNPDDKEGIVPYVIEKALTQNANANKDVKISIAYFVCYGRYESEKLNEVLLFFNIVNILEQKKDETETPELYQAYVNNIETDVALNSEDTYSKFYTNLMNKKMSKVKDFNKIKSFITKGDEYTIAQDNIDNTNDFRTILTEVTDIWYDVEGSMELSVNLKKIFEILLSEQKKINTVVPTKNNIESSRGHTCVLIRIKNNDDTCKYFPLFDMAGTEDPKEMEDFFAKAGNEKIAKLITKINKLDDKIIRDENGQLEVGSLNELLEEKTVKEYLENGQTGGATTARELVEKAETDNDVNNANKFITKIINEGHYINHTIGMIIFAAMCVGESLKTTKDGTDDHFDYFGNDLFNETIVNYVCTLRSGEVTGINCHGKPKILLENLSFDTILNSSSIWTQIIFSFLYWNTETQESTNAWVEEAVKNDIDESPYVCDMENYNFVDNIPIKHAKVLSEIDNSKIKSINDNFKNINENSKIFENNKFIVSVVNNAVKNSRFEQNYKISFTTVVRDTTHTYEITIDNEKFMKNIDAYNNLSTSIQNAYARITGEQQKDSRKKLLSELCKHIDGEVLKVIVKDVKRGVEDKTDSVVNNFKDTVCIGNGFDVYYMMCKKMNETLEIMKEMNTKIEYIESAIDGDRNLREFMNCGYVLTRVNSQLFFYKDEEKIDVDIEIIIEKAKKIPKAMEDDTATTTNQMQRIKDGRVTATKMILMHYVTGQIFKNPMVMETIQLTKNLYDSTNIQFEKETVRGGKAQTEAVPTVSEGLADITNTRTNPEKITTFRGGDNEIYKRKYLKYREKYLGLKYNKN